MFDQSNIRGDDITNIGKISRYINIPAFDSRWRTSAANVGDLFCKRRDDEAFVLSSTDVVKGTGDDGVEPFGLRPLKAQRLGGHFANRIWAARTQRVAFSDRQLGLVNRPVAIAAPHVQKSAAKA